MVSKLPEPAASARGVSFVALVVSALSAAACGGNNEGIASQLVQQKTFTPVGQAKCAVAKSQERPLIVEWPSPDRVALEAQAKRGLVAVRYAGCEMEVLPQCKGPGAYAYTPTTRQRDRVVVRDADELWTSLPLGAAKLEGALQKSGEITVAMTIVGAFSADRTGVAPEDLQGDCAKATHIVTALTVGTFQMYAGSDAAVGAGANVAGAGGGGKSTARRELLNEAGDEKACEMARADDLSPPYGCGALLRVVVAPLGEPKKNSPVCPQGTSWDGAACVGKRVECPPGSKWNGSSCTGAAPQPPAPAPQPLAQPQPQPQASSLIEPLPMQPRKPSPSRAGLHICKDGDVTDCRTQCSLGEAESCATFANMHERGAGVPKSEAKVIELYDKSCRGGSARGCWGLGWQYQSGKGVAVDHYRAAGLYRQACDLGDPIGCHNLGVAYEGGKGVPKDYAMALDFFRRGCNGSHALACSAFGNYVFNGWGTSANKPRGVEWVRRGCKMGDNWGCGKLKEFGYSP